MIRRMLLLVLAAGGATSGQAQEARLRGGYLEATVLAHRVTDQFGDWRGARLRAAVPAGSRDVLFLEALAQRAFGDDGVYAAAAHQHRFGDEWVTMLGIAGGTGAFFFPDLRVDAILSRKLLPSRRLVLSAGGSWIQSKDVYRDRALLLGATGYLADGVVVEAGLRFNWSRPGDQASQRVHGALTLGREGSRYLVLRGSAGTEAYQLTGTGRTERRFRSTEAAITWREWLGRRVGLLAAAEWYDNPFYVRTGGQVGLVIGW